MANTITPFHLAIPVDDLKAARDFYGGLLGCEEGRSAENWIDFNLYGHQLVCHRTDAPRSTKAHERKAHESNTVDDHAVPVPHFGVVLSMEDWISLRDKLRGAELRFGIEPYIRFAGQAGEQATMFFYDPSGNALEFKAFRDFSQLFAR